MIPVRFHHLKAMAQSPAHCRLAMSGVEDEPTRALKLGTKVHLRILGGELPPSPIVYPGKVRRGKDWELWKADNPGVVCVTESELREIQKEDAKVDAMALSAEKNKKAVELLTTGIREHTLYFDLLGRKCRATPDVFSEEAVTELKTTACAEPQRFGRDITKYGYHAAMAWYKQAIKLAGHREPQEAFIVSIESVRPYPTVVRRMGAGAMDIGARAVRFWFERLLTSEASDYWPGYCESVVDFDLEDEDVPLDFSGIEGGSQEVPF
jgi:hypothetical protein